MPRSGSSVLRAAQTGPTSQNLPTVGASGALDEVDYGLHVRNDPSAPWRPYAIQGREALSTIYELSVHIVSTSADADVDRLLNEDVTLSLRRGDGTRWIGGTVRTVEDLGATESARIARVVVVPRLWRLSLRSRCRVFVDRSIPEIVTEVLREWAIYPKDERVELLGERYPRRELTVQYNESDLAFVMRHLENLGIGFTFVHTATGEKLVLFDAGTAGASIPLGDPLGREVAVLDRGVSTAHEESLHDVAWKRRSVPGAAMVRSHDFTRPRAKMAWQAIDPLAPNDGTSEDSTRVTFHRYGGSNYHAEDGALLARVLQQAQSAEARVAVARGNVLAALVGGALRVTGHPRQEFDRKYLLTVIEHEGVARGDIPMGVELPGLGGKDKTRYENRLTLVPTEVTWRPRRVTPWPELSGPQTATVIRPPGTEEEVVTDVWGRTLVRFHWELPPSEDVRTSAWIRTAHAWAGPSYGVMTLLREGMEVVVHFLGGDPDRPLIMGCVYDGVNAPPLLLPDESSCTVFRSNSTPGGRGFNEVVVDDRDGAEMIRVRAQRDFDERVRRDRTARVDRDDATMVRGCRSAVVMEHDTLRAGKHLVIDAGAGVTIRVGESVLQILPDRVVIASPRVLLNCEGSVQTPDLSPAREEEHS